MTVPRNPIADCVLAMIGQLGETRVIEATGKSVNAIRKSSNPNEPGRAVALADIIALAGACEAAGLPHTVEDAIKAEIRLAAMRYGLTAVVGDPLMALAKVNEALGVVAGTVAQALSDGTIDAHEQRMIRKGTQALRERADLLDAAATARALKSA